MTPDEIASKISELEKSVEEARKAPLDPETAEAMHDETLPEEGFKDAAFATADS